MHLWWGRKLPGEVGASSFGYRIEDLRITWVVTAAAGRVRCLGEGNNLIFLYAWFSSCKGLFKIMLKADISYMPRFPDSSVGNLPAMWETCLILGLGRSPGEGKGNPVQYSGLENSMDYTVHGGHKESDMTEWLSLHFTLNICCKAGLVVLNSLNFCLSEKLLISPSILNEILARYSNLGCRFSPFSTLNISCHSLWRQ